MYTISITAGLAWELPYRNSVPYRKSAEVYHRRSRRELYRKIELMLRTWVKETDDAKDERIRPQRCFSLEREYRLADIFKTVRYYTRKSRVYCQLCVSSDRDVSASTFSATFAIRIPIKMQISEDNFIADFKPKIRDTYFLWILSCMLKLLEVNLTYLITIKCLWNRENCEKYEKIYKSFDDIRCTL